MWQVMGLVLAEFQDQIAYLVELPLRAVAVVGITQKLLRNEMVKMVVLAVAEEHREQISMRAVQEYQVKVLLAVLMVEYKVSLITVLAVVVARARLVERQLQLLTVLVA